MKKELKNYKNWFGTRTQHTGISVLYTFGSLLGFYKGLRDGLKVTVKGGYVYRRKLKLCNWTEDKRSGVMGFLMGKQKRNGSCEDEQSGGSDRFFSFKCFRNIKV